ncbi:MAG: hypothetical protein VYD57_13480 [Pseudomonadota bacterium]|nr:hypothetical protein [Pseudomonadota bacterium]
MINNSNRIHRRAVLSALATSAVAVAIPASAGQAPSQVSVEIAGLLKRFVDLKRAYADLDEAHDKAHFALPEWAAEGEMFVTADGSFVGAISPYPQVADWTAPEHTMERVLIRPSLDDVVSFHKKIADFAGRTPERRREVRRNAFAAIRKWIARRREQKSEMEKVGLPKIIAMQTAIDREIASADRLIEALGRAEPGNLDVAAARLIITLHEAYMLDDHIEIVCFRTLNSLMPHLHEPVREIAADVVQRLAPAGV